MKRMMSIYIALATLVLLLSFPRGVVESASDDSDILLSYDVVDEGISDSGHTSTLTVRLNIKNIGETAIDKVTAYVVGTKGMAVDFDHIFFGLIESGETMTSVSFDLVVETGNSQDIKRRGIVWDVRYERRNGTAAVSRVRTYFRQEPGSSR
jgi:hypothetical protein